MAKSTLLSFTRLSAALILGAGLAGAPAFADKGGNGNGGGHGGGIGGGSSQSASDHSNNGKSSKGDDATETETEAGASTKLDASTAGKLNGFLHASPRAIAKANANSAIGKVAVGYGGMLKDYLSPAPGTTPPTAAEVAAALAAASNKPLTAEVVAAVNAKLLDTNPDLAVSLTTSGKTAADLDAEIAAAF